MWSYIPDMWSYIPEGGGPWRFDLPGTPLPAEGWGLGLGVWGLGFGFGVERLGFRVREFVLGLWFSVWSSWCGI